MALVLQDRVSVNSTGSGTGSLVLGSAYPGFRTFASCIPTGSIVYYTITNQAVGLENEWEVGYGTYTLSTNTLSRDSVYSSSNAGSLVNFTAGTNGLQVFITYPAEQAVFQQPDGVTEFNEGPISVVGANATAGTFTSTLAQFTSNEPNFSQLYIQNQSADANASTDIAAYNNLGDGTYFFVDMGIAGSNYDQAAFPIFQENDAYVYSYGNATTVSRLLIGTQSPNANVVIFGGSVEANAVITTFEAATKNVNFANNISATSNVSANNVIITNFAYSGANLAAAANGTVLVTKTYVDEAVSNGFHVHEPVNLATTAALSGTPTYNQPNGSSNGVGATLTATGVGTLDVDGQNADFGFRILVRSQANAVQNGIYTVTTEGTGGAAYQLTRATDADTYVAQSDTGLGGGDYFFVSSGDTQAYFSFICTNDGTITFGTTPITFQEFSSVPVYIGTAPINVSGQTIALTGIVPVANGGTNLSSFTTGDVIYSNATNSLAKLAIGSQYSVLSVSGAGVPHWSTVNLSNASAVSGSLGATFGGTGQTTYTLGDIIYSNATNTLAKLAGQTTTTQKFLSQTGNGTISGAPVWDTIPAGSITGLGTMSTQNANNVSITGGAISGASGSFTTLAYSSTLTGGTGVVNLGSNQFYKDTAGNIGVGVVPSAWASTFKALQLGSSAIYNNNANDTVIGANYYYDGTNNKYINTDSASAYALLDGQHIWYTAPSGTAGANTTFTERFRIGAAGQWGIAGANYGTAGQVFVSGGASAAPSWTTTVASATTATNIAGGAAGSIPYQSGSGTTQLLATGTGVLVGGTTPAYSTTPTLTGTNFSAIPNSALSNSSTTINGTAIALGSSGTITAVNPNALTIGTGLSGTSYNGSAAVTITNTGVTSATGGTGISVSASTGGVTFTNTGVTSLTGTANQITVSASTGGVTLSTPQAIATGSSVQFGSFGVGTAASGTTGEIRATNNITAYFSDDRMKNNLGNIPDALAKLKTLNGFYYEANDVAQAMGYEVKKEVGVSAQQVQAVMPEVVAPAPIDENYLTVRYERLVPLLIEAIKELEAQVAELKAK
jgi:hypothetical protein